VESSCEFGIEPSGSIKKVFFKAREEGAARKTKT
jgi:hypothetical protein